MKFTIYVLFSSNICFQKDSLLRFLFCWNLCDNRKFIVAARTDKTLWDLFNYAWHNKTTYRAWHFDFLNFFFHIVFSCLLFTSSKEIQRTKRSLQWIVWNSEEIRHKKAEYPRITLRPRPDQEPTTPMQIGVSGKIVQK